jgi:hypothetical protein
MPAIRDSLHRRRFIRGRYDLFVALGRRLAEAEQNRPQAGKLAA